MTATIPGLLAAGSDGAPSIISTKGPSLTGAELAEVVGQGAAAIRSAGIDRLSRVAIVIPDGFEMAIALLAVSSAAVAMPISPRLRSSDLAAALARLQADTVVTMAGAPEITTRPGLRHLVVGSGESGEWWMDGDRLSGTPIPYPQPEAVALLLHTSGTTGRPKGVPLTHRNLTSSAATIAAWFSLDATDRSLTAMPLSHIHGIVAGLLAPLAGGGGVIAPPQFDATRVSRWMELHRPTWFSAVPTMHQMILARIQSAPVPLRFVRSSSAPLPHQVLRGLEELFRAPAIETLGMTEASHQVAANPMPPGLRKPGSVGVPAGAEIRIVGSGRIGMAPDSVGEIEIRGPGVFGGYEGDSPPQMTDGWFATGDIGRIDADGYLFISGRIKEMINRGGEKVAPREVEDVLLEHPAVSEAAVFAIADRWLGEAVAAAVVLRSGATAREMDLVRHVRSALPPFMVPRTVTITDVIPKGESGKVQRNLLGARFGLVSPPHRGPIDSAARVTPPPGAAG